MLGQSNFFRVILGTQDFQEVIISNNIRCTDLHTSPIILHESSQYIITNTHFTDEETEAQRS